MRVRPILFNTEMVKSEAEAKLNELISLNINLLSSHILSLCVGIYNRMKLSETFLTILNC